MMQNPKFIPVDCERDGPRIKLSISFCLEDAKTLDAVWDITDSAIYSLKFAYYSELDAYRMGRPFEEKGVIAKTS